MTSSFRYPITSLQFRTFLTRPSVEPDPNVILECDVTPEVVEGVRCVDHISNWGRGELWLVRMLIVYEFPVYTTEIHGNC